ncbi:MAG TPA: low molecular weight protein-tyrosine-phosphatase [Casimicrobiaceae bacterium]|nr:low molecular weight protein-tyrosine-phosphatase [Casimicrobiaceae bacterium]
MTSVLFVCTGNICRSPTVESVFRALVAREGLSREIVADSAGTHDYQLGQPPDPRAVRAARRRGYELPARVARQFHPGDFEHFDWILAMDRDNMDSLEPFRPREYAGYLGLFLDFAPEVGVREIPDPYQGTASDFDRVLDLAEQGAEPLLAAIRATLKRAR